MEENQTSLISGLPDDMALSCLARVPRKWRELVCCDEFYDYRRVHSLSETWMYALCCDRYGKIWFYVLDPNESQRRWKCVPGLPARALNKMGMGFEVIGKKVYLLGGGGWLDATNEVFCYDVSRIHGLKCDSACQVYDGKIYAIGGLASTRSDPYSWDIFDPRTNSWELHSNACAVPEVEDSVVLDGKIYIRCQASASTMSSPFYAVVYEPSSGTWQRADADMVSGWQGPAVVVDGTLYVLDQSSGTKLMMWQKDKREWVAVKRSIGKKLFIVGKGLSTVVLDTSQTGSVEGAMVGTSIPGLITSDKVLNCKFQTL
ncbi:SKP1 INTERACTING PARTNER family protein [Salix suchowensis]|nr:SKP1 INTERACTING PARTNER family protein [Salix suchowensis]